jgi:hypothetical protein
MTAKETGREGEEEKEQREAKHAGNEADFIPKEVVAGEE